MWYGFSLYTTEIYCFYLVQILPFDQNLIKCYIQISLTDAVYLIYSIFITLLLNLINCFLLLELACSNIFLDITANFSLNCMGDGSLVSPFQRCIVHGLLCIYAIVNAPFWNLGASRFKLLFCTSAVRFYFDYLGMLFYYFFPFLFISQFIILLIICRKIFKTSQLLNLE